MSWSYSGGRRPETPARRSHPLRQLTIGTCALTAAGDQENVDPALGPLQDNGGLTETHSLLEGSPAIDNADETGCLETDQRGVTRPIGDRCDVGAYEGAVAAATETPTPGPTETPTAGPTETAEPTGTATATPAATATATPTVSFPACPGATAPPGGTCPPCPGFERAGVESTCPPTAPAGQQVAWGDANCSGEADPVDSLLVLRHDAGLSANTGDCPDLGAEVDVLNASLHVWGDVDCSDEVNPIDSLKILRFDAGLSVSQEADCPQMGGAIAVVVS